MMKVYKIEIKLTEEQKLKVNKTIGTCRFIYNLYIQKNKEEYEKNKKFISGFDFSKWLNNDFIKRNHSYSWIKDVSSKAVKQSIMNGDKAFKNFFKGLSKFPKFKKKKDIVGVYLPKNNNTDFTLERHRIKVPTIGFVRFKEFGYIPLNSKIKSGTITKDTDKYFISILVEEQFGKTSKINNNEGLGIDLGLKDFATISNKQVFKNINKSIKVKKLEKSLKRQQKSLSRKIENKKRKGGETANNIQKNILKVKRLHRKLRNIRIEYVKHCVNSLVKLSPKFITIEDLNIRSMLKNRHLSKAISKQNFYYFRLFLTQQCNKNNIELRVVDRWFPSSKTCNYCGRIKTDLKLKDRVYKCDCGYIESRDLNASYNLKDCSIYKIAN